MQAETLNRITNMALPFLNGFGPEYNSFLVAHNRPAKSLRDLLTNQTEVDNVTLTVNENLQLKSPGRRRRRPRASTAPRRWSSTPPPARSRPCTRIRPSIPTRWCRQDTKTARLECLTRRGGQPAGGRHLRPDLSARLQLQGGHHLRGPRAPSRPGRDDLPGVASSPFPTPGLRPRC